MAESKVHTSIFWQINAFYAPWSTALPPLGDTTVEAPHNLGLSESSHTPIQRTQFASNIELELPGNEIEAWDDPDHQVSHLGMISIARSPILAHAVVASFFESVAQTPTRPQPCWEVDTRSHLHLDPNLGLNPRIAHVHEPTSTSAAETGTGASDVHYNSVHYGCMPPAVVRDGMHPSTMHDQDVIRLLACASPTHSLGLRPSFSVGTFAGSWEGQFSFLDLDRYRFMLSEADDGMKHACQCNHQAQMWKLKERVVRLAPGEKPGGNGDMLSPEWEARKTSAEHVVKKVRVPKEVHARCVDPAWVRAHQSAQEERTQDEAEEEDKQDVSMDEDCPSFGPDELSREEAEEYTDDPDRYEIRIHGTGHSAWGRFTLRGRVRSWDGLLVVRKSYDTDDRGQWLYRGYALAGACLVGRWRDVVTPRDMTGYEGYVNPFPV